MKPAAVNRRRLFEGFGTELECMIVDAGTLSVLPVADRILELASGDRSYIHALPDKSVLSRRILDAVGGDFSREKLRGIYRELAECLREGRMFRV